MKEKEKKELIDLKEQLKIYGLGTYADLMLEVAELPEQSQRELGHIVTGFILRGKIA